MCNSETLFFSQWLDGVLSSTVANAMNQTEIEYFKEGCFAAKPLSG